MVSCGDAFTLILTEKKQVYSFGKGTHGRLGIGERAGDQENACEPALVETLKNEKVVQISAGCRHAACVTGKVEYTINTY